MTQITSADGLDLGFRTQIVKGVFLPYDIPAYKNASAPMYNREGESGRVFIPLSALEDLLDAAPFDSAIINFSRQQEAALENAGWATRQTRGGVCGTEAFRKSKIPYELYDRYEDENPQEEVR